MIAAAPRPTGAKMMTSYFLSRTLIPTMIQYLLPAELLQHGKQSSILDRMHAKFNAAFDALDAWMKQFRRIAKVALREEPGLKRMIGL